MKSRDPAVDAYVRRAKSWQPEIEALRTALLECGLEEALKWGKPCFTYAGANVAIIQPFKTQCALMFFKGALIEDSLGLLRRQGENTQAAMRLEFSAGEPVRKSVVKTYARQAIAVEKAGLAVDFKARRELEFPEELTRALAADRRLANAFDALTPGRRRGYVLHFAGARRPETRVARIDKCRPRILAGKGLHE